MYWKKKIKRCVRSTHMRGSRCAGVFQMLSREPMLNAWLQSRRWWKFPDANGDAITDRKLLARRSWRALLWLVKPCWEHLALNCPFVGLRLGTETLGSCRRLTARAHTQRAHWLAHGQSTAAMGGLLTHTQMAAGFFFFFFEAEKPCMYEISSDMCFRVTSRPTVLGKWSTTASVQQLTRGGHLWDLRIRLKCLNAHIWWKDHLNKSQCLEDRCD